MEVAGQRLHAERENTGDFVETQSEEIFYLGAGDQDGDAVGESDDNGTRNEFHACAETGCSHDDEEHSCHHGTHEQSVGAMCSHDAGDYDDKGAGRSADLGFRSGESGDEKSGYDGAVGAGLRSES